MRSQLLEDFPDRSFATRAGVARETDERAGVAREKDAGAGRVEAIREAVHEAVGEVVAGGSSIRLLIRVHCAPGRLEKDQSSNRLSNWLYIRPLEE